MAAPGSARVKQLKKQEPLVRATVIGLLKNWPVKFLPVIFGLLPYANEIWRHIFQILKNITG